MTAHPSLPIRFRAGLTPNYDPFQDACAKAARMADAWKANPDRQAWRDLLEASTIQHPPVAFEPAEAPATQCPAY